MEVHLHPGIEQYIGKRRSEIHAAIRKDCAPLEKETDKLIKKIETALGN